MDQWKTKVDLRKRDISRQKRSSATEPTIFGENGKVWNKEDQVFFTFVDLEKGREGLCFSQIWEGGDLEVESTTLSKVEEERSGNHSWKSSDRIQGSWGGRDKRLKTFCPKILHYLLNGKPCVRGSWSSANKLHHPHQVNHNHHFHHDLIYFEGRPCLRRLAKCQPALHLPQSLFLITSSSSGSEKL